MTKIIFKTLSYRVVGILYQVIKELGGSYHEKYYQRAVESLLNKYNIPYRREQPVDIMIMGTQIGKHYLDFVIDDKLILEIKKGSYVKLTDIKQVLMYLKTSGYKLGILAYFGSDGVITKRVLNSY